MRRWRYGVFVKISLILLTPAAIPAFGGMVVGWPANSVVVPEGLTDVVAVAVGAGHNLALKSDGTVVGWGINTWGQATPPPGLSDVVTVAAGVGHSLALKSDGTIVGWGSNEFNETIPPAGLVDVMAIGAGLEHSLALRADGTVIGWGSIGGPPRLTGIVAIAAGFTHALALRNDGTVVGWGLNDEGETTPPPGLTDVVDIAAGSGISLALKADGTVVGWGGGSATPPPGLDDVVDIAAGGHALALRSDGTVVGWGGGGTATPPPGLSNVVAIAVGNVSLAVTTSPPSDPDPPVLRFHSFDRTVDGLAVMNLFLRDTWSGLQAIEVIASSNAAVVLPSFEDGTQDSLLARAMQLAGGSLSVTLQATDMTGNVVEETFLLHDSDADTYPLGPDCDDADSAIHPDQEEVYYNGKNDDCSGSTIDNDRDADGVTVNDDCDDGDFRVGPGRQEIPENGKDDDCNPATPDSGIQSSFSFTVHGQPQSALTLRQGNPPVLTFHLVGANGYVRDGSTPIPTLRGCGTILSVRVVGRQVVVTATNGVYVSRDGFLYTKSS